MSDKIDMNDIPLVSKTGKWVIKVDGKRKQTHLELYRARLKAATLKHTEYSKTFGTISKTTKRAKRELDFYTDQLDPEQSDLFALSMFATEDWQV